MTLGNPLDSRRLLNCSGNWLGDTTNPVLAITLALAWIDEIDPVSIDAGIIVELVNGECVVAGQLDDETTVGSTADVP